MVFPCPGAAVLRGASSPKNRVLERDPSSSEILNFYGFQKLRPSLPWCFPVRCAVFPCLRIAFWSGTSS